MIILGIIVAIILFSIIILVHEWGHFASARKFGVRVEEFGLGIPPRAKKLFTDKKGTLFSLNWLPIGGFVRLTGEMPNTFLVYNEKKELYNNKDLESDIEAKKNIFDKDGKKVTLKDKKEILKKLKENRADYNLMNKPAWQQAIIILAGVFMNFLLASIIFSILFFVGVKPLGINTKIETDLNIKLIPTYEQAIESGLLIKETGIILTPVKGSVSEKLGIMKGDILEKAPHPLSGTSPQKEKEELTTQKLIDIISNNPQKELVFNLKRDNKKINIIIIPENIDGKGKIGSYLSENIKLNKEFKYEYNTLDSIKYGIYETYNQALLTFKAIKILIKKIFNPETPKERQEAIKQVSGPIGVVDFISNSMEAGITFIIILGAIISINLGVFNLLPIPALDGGRFIFITINGLIEKIFGRKAISEKTEGIIHFLFFIFLIALSIIIAYNDIIKIIFR